MGDKDKGDETNPATVGVSTKTIDLFELINTTDEGQDRKKRSRITIDPLVTEQLKDFKDIRKEFEELKKDFITMFGIFASFVTFLSVEIQIFKVVNNFWLLIGLSSFLLSSVLLFSFAIKSLIHNKMEWKELNNPLIVFIGVFLAISIFCFGKFSKEQKQIWNFSRQYLFIKATTNN